MGARTGCKGPAGGRRYGRKGIQKNIHRSRRTQVLRELGAWRECVDLETGNLYHTPPGEEEFEAYDDDTDDGDDTEQKLLKDDIAKSAIVVSGAAERTESGDDDDEKQKPRTQWEKPEEAFMAERTRFAWAVVRQRSELFREGADDETGDFEEYVDPVTKSHFWYYWRTGITRTEMPKCLLPQDADEIEAEREAEDARRKQKPVYKSLEEVRRAREEDGYETVA